MAFPLAAIGPALLSWIKNPKIILAIAAIAFCGFVLWKYDSMTDRLFEQEQTIVDLQTEVKNNKETTKKIQENIQAVEQANKRLEHEVNKGQQRISHLSNQLDSIDLEKLFNKSPEKASLLVNQVFDNILSCLEKSSGNQHVTCERDIPDAFE